MIKRYLSKKNISIVLIAPIVFITILLIKFYPSNASVPKSILEELKPGWKKIHHAMNSKNIKEIQTIKSKLVQTLGDYVGVSEVDPNYEKNIDISEPNISQLIVIWNESNKENTITRPWVNAIKLSGYTGTKAPRLRKTLRQALAELRSAEFDVLGKKNHLEIATDAFDYLVKVQSPTGVFGFPVGGDSKGNVARIVKNKIDEAKKRSKNILWKDWIVDDLGSGDLKFDNGMVGAGLIYAYWMTGNPEYLISAKKAGAWAMKQNYSANFNYNSFSGYLLARLYRATGNLTYLKAAEDIFDYAVLPGQMENGRWFDPHNARIQYHSVMMRALIEYYLALQAVESKKAEKVKLAIVKGLDHLAMEITTFGISNPHEMLSLDALALGALAIEDKPLWKQAMNANVNYLMNGYWEKLLAHQLPVPNGVANYIIYRQSHLNEIKGYEFKAQLQQKYEVMNGVD